MTGSQWSQTPKTYARSRPRKKIGIEMPRSESTVATLSNSEPWRFAAATPSGIPKPIATIIAATVSSTVAGKRVMKLVATDTRLVAEVPKSPWITPFM